MAAERRAELVAWAQATGGLIVEDDYDGEFRYDAAPQPVLQRDAPDRVVYGGTASKMLSPALRLGWLVVPAWLMPAVRQAKFLDDRATGTLEQLALARLVESGDLARHLRRVRPIYRRRRDAALRALARHLPGARAEGADAGLHLFVRLPPGTDERALVAGAAARNVRVEGAAAHWARPAAAPPSLALGYAELAEPAVERAVALLGEAYREASPRSRTRMARAAGRP
jgi:GntR family transcriptional regulator/MocR family aminotransferase